MRLGGGLLGAASRKEGVRGPRSMHSASCTTATPSSELEDKEPFLQDVRTEGPLLDQPKCGQGGRWSKSKFSIGALGALKFSKNA